MATRPVLLFDVLGTLVYDPFYLEVPAFFGMSLTELLRVKHPSAWAEFERGAIDESEFLARFFRDGRAYDTAGMMRCMADAYRWLDGMEDLLGELSRADYEIHALSNYPSWYEWIEARLGLSRYLTWSFVSCRTGVRKPDPGSFTGPLETLGVAPGECVFVDDRPENCEAARSCGLKALLFSDASSLSAALRELGVP